MNIYTHTVYWIHLPEHNDITTQGYVGVSNDPKRRMAEHKNSSAIRNDKNPFFGRVLNKYPDKIIQTVIFYGTKEACYSLEESLRPLKNIGWNVNKGGSCPPTKRGWTPSKTTLEKRSRALKGIPRTNNWRKNLSEAKQGVKNGMYGRKIPCDDSRKIAIIRSKNQHRINDLIQLFKLLQSGETIRNISTLTGYGTATIIDIKKDSRLHLEAFPILKQFKAS